MKIHRSCSVVSYVVLPLTRSMTKFRLLVTPAITCSRYWTRSDCQNHKHSDQYKKQPNVSFAIWFCVVGMKRNMTWLFFTPCQLFLPPFFPKNTIELILLYCSCFMKLSASVLSAQCNGKDRAFTCARWDTNGATVQLNNMPYPVES